MNHLVFVYGTLRRGEGNSHLLKGAKYVGTALSNGANYGMTTSADNGGIPFLYNPTSLHAKINTPFVLALGSGRVAGEIWQVDGETFAALDRLEGHPRFYKRMRRSFRVDIAEADIQLPVTAWVYLSNRPWGHRVAPKDGVLVAPRQWRFDQLTGEPVSNQRKVQL